MPVPVLVFAQSVVERGLLDSLGSSLQQSTDTLGSWLGSLSPTTWLVAIGVVIVVLVIWGRARQ